MACTNPNTKLYGRCEYCDARCPYYSTASALIQAINGLPGDISDGLKDLAHDIALEQVENAVRIKED